MSNRCAEYRLCNHPDEDHEWQDAMRARREQPVRSDYSSEGSETVDDFDDWSWHDIMRDSRDTDYIGQCKTAIQERDDLAMLVRRLIYRHGRELPLDEAMVGAAEYLTRKGLNGSPLREETDEPHGSDEASLTEKP